MIEDPECLLRQALRHLRYDLDDLTERVTRLEQTDQPPPDAGASSCPEKPGSDPQ